MAGMNNAKIQGIIDAMAAAGIIQHGQQVTGDQIAGVIEAVRLGIDTGDATAGAGDILSGKTAYAKGLKVAGTMPSVEQAAPSISVSASGLITASAAQSAGYVGAGTKAQTSQLATQAAATIMPGPSAKTAVAAGRWTTGAVTVAGSGNLGPSNIRSGVNIFGVIGTLNNTYTTRFSVTGDGTSITLSSLNKSDLNGIYGCCSFNDVKSLGEYDCKITSFLSLRVQNRVIAYISSVVGPDTGPEIYKRNDIGSSSATFGYGWFTIDHLPAYHRFALSDDWEAIYW